MFKIAQQGSNALKVFLLKKNYALKLADLRKAISLYAVWSNNETMILLTPCV